MKYSSLKKSIVFGLTVFLLTFQSLAPVHALTDTEVTLEKNIWDHESITNHLKQFDPYQEGLTDNAFVTEVERDSYVFHELDYITLEDRFLNFHNKKILDLSSFYNTDNPNILDKSSPVNIGTSVFNLIESEKYKKDLYIFNVRWNMYTGGRDPGENYFYIVEKDTSAQGESSEYVTSRLDFPTHYKVAHLYIDRAQTVWIDGYDFYSRYANFPRTTSIFPDKSIVKWSETIASDNLQSPSLDLNTDLRLGQAGIYLWAWPADSAENDWASFDPLKDGGVFKYDPSKSSKSMVEVARAGEKSKYYGTRSSGGFDPLPPRNILITEDDQIFYDTHFDGYMHFNQDTFTPYTIKSDVTPDQIGQVAGAYKKESLHLVNYEGKEIDVYCVDGAYTIVAEALQDFGYTMYYDPDERFTLIHAQYDDGQKLSMPRIEDSGNIYTTDIRLFLGNKEIRGYNIGGASLVKLTDLNLSSESYKLTYTPSGVARHPDTSISGNILLDNEPAHGLESVRGEVVLYGSNNSSEFYGFNEFEYTGWRIDDLTPVRTSPMVYNADTETLTFAFTKDTLKDLPTYKTYFIGYKLDDGDMDTSMYLSDTQENKGDLIHLSSFKKTYTDLQLTLPSKVRVEGQVKFLDSVYALDDTAPRRLVFEIMKRDGNRIQDDKTLVFTGQQSDETIPFHFDLDKNGVYEIQYTLYTYYKGDHDSSVYDINAIRTPVTQSRWVPIKSLLSDTDDTTIYLEDIELSYKENESVGTAYKTDITVQFNGHQAPALNIDGYMVTPIQALEYLGFELSTKSDEQVIELIDSDIDASKLQCSPFRLAVDYSNLIVGDYLGIQASMTPFKLKYQDIYIPVFKVQDRLVINIDRLKVFGFDFDFNEETRQIFVEYQQAK